MALNDHQIAIIAVNAVFPSLAAVFIGLRLYAKRIKKPKLQADDCLILLGFVCSRSVLLYIIFIICRLFCSAIRCRTFIVRRSQSSQLYREADSLQVRSKGAWERT